MSRRSRDFSVDDLLDVAPEQASGAVRRREVVAGTLTLPVTGISRSPFQPAGRPSRAAIEAVEAAVSEVGSLAELFNEEGRLAHGALSREAQALADLAADIAANGVDSPLEVRRVGGNYELLSGHRRLAAAIIARLIEVPVVDRGTIPDHEAATVVARRNLLRRDFTPWQEAVILADVRARRRAAGLPDTVRALGSALGFSYARAAELLRFLNALPPELLEKIGPTDHVTERLGALSYRDLRALSAIADSDARAKEAGRRLQFIPTSPSHTNEAPTCQVAALRSGGFSLQVRKNPDDMLPHELQDLERLLSTKLRLVRSAIRSREQASSSGGGSDS